MLTLSFKGLPYSGALDAWDFGFYERILEETKYQVDEEVIKEYFPLDYVINQVSIMLFNLCLLTFIYIDLGVVHAFARSKHPRVDRREIEGYYSPLPSSSSCSGLISIYFQEGIWHEQVKLYEVRDKSTNDLLGHFYLDLFPRDGKYSHQVKYSTL